MTKELEKMTIPELEALIKVAEKAPKEETQIRKQIPQYKKLIKSRYAMAKNATLVFEKDNLDHLMLVRSTNGFWKIFGRSALFYVDGIATKIGRSARILVDDDYCDRSQEGCCAIRDINKTIEGLEKLGCTQDMKLSNTEVIAYKLPWTYREKDVKRLKDNNQMYLGMFEKSVLPQNMYPTMFTQINELTRAVYENTRQMKDPLIKDAIGKDFVQSAFKIEQLYLMMANKACDKEKAFTEMLEMLNLLKIQSKIIADLNIWQPATCARLAKLFMKNAQIITRELEKTTNAKR